MSGQSHASTALHAVKVPRTHETEGWVSSRTGLENLKEINLSYPCREPNDDCSDVQLLACFLYRRGYPG